MPAGSWGTGRYRHYSGTAQPGPPRDRPPAPAPPPPPRWRILVPVIGLILTVLLFASPSAGTSKPTQKLAYSDFLHQVTAGQVATATIGSTGNVTGKLGNGDSYTTQVPTAVPDDQLLPLLKQHNVLIKATAPGGISLLDVLLNLLPFLLFLAFFVYLGRRTNRQIGGLMRIGSSKAKVYDVAARPPTRFADVAGYEGVKREVSEVVEYLKHPDKYRKAGAIGPRGVLMVGPPGSGKTLLARAVAGEAEVPFLALTGSSFVEMFVGVGAARVRDLFADARKRAPSIIFIDEIDAIGSRRAVGGFASNDEREQTLNQLLAEMDGFDTATGVVVMGATNRPESLDPALLRPGRFDRTVEVPLPNQAERRAILEVHCRGKKLAPDVNLDVVARGTPGFSGADLANLVNEAAISAVREDRDVLTGRDFDAARDRIILGRRDASNALLPAEKYAVAVHESGHTIVAIFSEHADPVAKVTILPSGLALGVTEQLPEAERHLYPESYLYDSLAIRLGGRAAEVLILGEASTGAANDLTGATNLATRMVRDWGMSPKLGPVGFGSAEPSYLGLPDARPRSYAEATQRLIDEEVARLLREADKRASDVISDQRAVLQRLVDLLMAKETVDGSEVYALVGRPEPGALGPEDRPVPASRAAALGIGLTRKA
jgi:cell division protease FtsH